LDVSVGSLCARSSYGQANGLQDRDAAQGCVHGGVCLVSLNFRRVCILRV